MTNVQLLVGVVIIAGLIAMWYHERKLRRAAEFSEQITINRTELDRLRRKLDEEKKAYDDALNGYHPIPPDQLDLVGARFHRPGLDVSPGGLSEVRASMSTESEHTGELQSGSGQTGGSDEPAGIRFTPGAYCREEEKSIYCPGHLITDGGIVRGNVTVT